jgi:negative regulator of sigma E activity
MPTRDQQPPLVKPPLYLQIRALKEEAHRQNQQPVAPIAPVNQSKALYEGVKEWKESMTPEQLKRSYSTIEVIQLANLKGKYRDMPARQEVATALRKNGFESKRSWTNANRNRRFWISTGDNK